VNAIHHGNLEISSSLRESDERTYYNLAEERRHQEPYVDRRVHVFAKETNREAMYVIRDEGPGFDPRTLPDPTDPTNIEKVSGRGILLIRTFMDEVNHNKTGNEITMIKRRDR
jgi:anti-sigma regulatory factor (Ser/Thr protein kinase)